MASRTDPVMTRENVAMQDQEDVTDYLRFKTQFPKDEPAKEEAPLITAASTGKEKTDSTPGEGAFAQWWAKDDTQANFQGLLGVLGGIGSGLAGIPLGGTDMSSLERGAARAMAAPGVAREELRQKKFVEYIDGELDKETNAGRRQLLEAARANPKQAAQYLAMEGPESKQKRAEAILALEHKYKMEEIGLTNEGKYLTAGLKRRGITAGRQDLIDSANAWFQNLPADTREEAKEGDLISLLFDPSAIKFMPYLYSPHGGLLYRGPGDFNMDLSGTFTYQDEDGNDKTVGRMDYLTQKYNQYYDELGEVGKNFFDLILMRHRQKEEDQGLSEQGQVVESDLFGE